MRLGFIYSKDSWVILISGPSSSPLFLELLLCGHLGPLPCHAAPCSMFPLCVMVLPRIFLQLQSLCSHHNHSSKFSSDANFSINSFFNASSQKYILPPLNSYRVFPIFSGHFLDCYFCILYLLTHPPTN